MRFRGPLLLVNVLIVLGLILTDVAIGFPRAAVTGQARAAASPAGSDGMNSPTLAGKRAKVKRERRQDDRQETKEDRKKDRKQPESKQAESNQGDPKQDRQQDRGRGTQQEAGKPIEIESGALPGAATIAMDQPSAEDRYIVLLADGTSDAMRATTDIASPASGITPTHVYEHVFNGFAAIISDDQLDAVEKDPRVLAVVPDVVGYPAEQTVTTGITRISADLDPTAKIDGIDERVDVDVAVLDTAGDDSHPDLNIWAWSNCTDNQLVNHDVDGHGTHVGGTIGALDNDFGVVGVAPGARLWNIKVMRPDANGNSFYSGAWVICALDLVTRYATDQGDGLGDIEVSNASLGGNGADSNCQTNFNDLFHQAFCRTVAAGVPVVVAAMNNSVNAANGTPATYEEVITVSALADSDGLPGGRGPVTPRGPDESLASFSNFGADVDIAAPGVNVLSTVPTGVCNLCHPSGFGLADGTSMAAPHVAGAAALFLANHPGASPAQVRTTLLNDRERIVLFNDPDGINEGVLSLTNAPPPPTVSPAPPAADAPPPSPHHKKKKHKKKKKKH